MSQWLTHKRLVRQPEKISPRFFEGNNDFVTKAPCVVCTREGTPRLNSPRMHVRLDSLRENACDQKVLEALGANDRGHNLFYSVPQLSRGNNMIVRNVI